MKYVISVDYREDTLISELKKIEGDFEVKTENLQIGDIIISKQDNIPLILLERKTEEDLVSSINDGRYREQKLRLHKYKEENPNIRIYFLIEKKKLYDSKKKKLLQSAILSIIVKDEFSVIYSESVEQSAEILAKLPQKLADIIPKTEQSGGDYYSAIKVKKIDNLTSNVWYLSSLELIPRISKNIASAIVEKYTTFDELYNELKTNGSKNISGIQTGNGEKKRKIGEKTANIIANIILGKIY